MTSHLCFVCVGSSGSPCFRADGTLVGVIVAPANGACIATPARHLRNLLHGLLPSPEPDNSPSAAPKSSTLEHTTQIEPEVLDFDDPKEKDYSFLPGVDMSDPLEGYDFLQSSLSFSSDTQELDSNRSTQGS